MTLLQDLGLLGGGGVLFGLGEGSSRSLFSVLLGFLLALDGVDGGALALQGLVQLLKTHTLGLQG